MEPFKRLVTQLQGLMLYPRQAQLKMEERDAYPLEERDNRTFSMEEIDDILRDDLNRFERGVERYCPVKLTQGQFDALVSFSFNVGLGTLQRSTLRQKVLRGKSIVTGKQIGRAHV